MKNLNKQKGIIKYIFYIFILILILSYFGFNIKEFMHKDITKTNLGYIGGLLFDFWEKYLKPIYDFLSDFFGPFISQTLDNLRNHNDTLIPDINNIVPKI